MVDNCVEITCFAQLSVFYRFPNKFSYWCEREINVTLTVYWWDVVKKHDRSEQVFLVVGHIEEVKQILLSVWVFFSEVIFHNCNFMYAVSWECRQNAITVAGSFRMHPTLMERSAFRYQRGRAFLGLFQKQKTLEKGHQCEATLSVWGYIISARLRHQCEVNAISASIVYGVPVLICYCRWWDIDQRKSEHCFLPQ